MQIRPYTAADFPQWTELRFALWPEETLDSLAAQGETALRMDPPLLIFVAGEEGNLAGFIEMSLRAYAEGSDSSPTPYIEGWYVRPAFQKQGIGRALMDAATEWARAHGYTEMGSDALADNQGSREAHKALGWREVETLVVFHKDLDLP